MAKAVSTFLMFEGRAEEAILSTVLPVRAGGAPLLDAILANVHQRLAGQAQPTVPVR